MSAPVDVNSVLTMLPTVSLPLMRRMNLSMPQKMTLVSVTLGVALIGFLARYLRRRRTNERWLPPRAVNTIQLTKSPNGDLRSAGRRSASPGIRNLVRQGSVMSDRMSMASGWLTGGTPASSVAGDASAHLTPQQLGVMGMEALETAVNYWEDALASYKLHQGDAATPLAVTSTEEAEFSNELHTLLDSAYELQNRCELLFLDQRSVLFRTDDSSARAGRYDTGTVLTSSPESFVSAQDEVADLREFEEFAEVFPDLDKLPLYQAAQKQFEEEGVPCRVFRTEVVHCQSDIEFLCKLHCVRLGCQFLFRQDSMWVWLSDAGRQVLTNLLLFADKDPKDLLVAYEAMLDFLQDQSNWTTMEQELLLKGVKAMTFYDIVMDFILLDAFEELEQPPSSVTAVVQNRWLSNGFKETALATAVWSVLKAKRRMLKFPSGFMAHFYAISEQISPLMAWGFLGPETNLRETCRYFKDQILGFLIDTFSFHKTRYTSIEDMSTDILVHIKGRVEAISSHLAQHQS